MTCTSLTLLSWNVKSIHHPATRKKYCLNKNGKERETVDIPLFRFQTRPSPRPPSRPRLSWIQTSFDFSEMGGGVGGGEAVQWFLKFGKQVFHSLITQKWLNGLSPWFPEVGEGKIFWEKTWRWKVSVWGSLRNAGGPKRKNVVILSNSWSCYLKAIKFLWSMY